jgi:hypothetical protein
MNIVFHCVAATGILAVAAGTLKKSDFKILIPSLLVLGIISHGALDYIPHQYPIISLIDVLGGLFFIFVVLFFVHSSFWLPIIACYGGSILPDIIDHTPEISNKFLHTNLPVLKNIFPWHWHDYSGSLYGVGAIVSDINHLCLIFFVIVIVIWNRQALKVLSLPK